MNLPPQSIHVWRQCNTLAVARNFHEENMDILKPRVDGRLDQSGVTGMQFPSYEYLVALGYGLVGEHQWVHRTVSFIIYCFGAWGIYELFLVLFHSSWAAALGAWSFCWSPELFYFGISALPDVLALVCSIWGLTLFLWWNKSGKVFWLLPSWFATTLGGLTKIQFLVVGFPMAVLVVRDWKKWKPRQWAAFVLYGATCVGLTLAWYHYAEILIATTGLSDFGLYFKPAQGWIPALKTIWHNAVSEIPELLLNYATFVFFVVGVVAFWKPGWQRSEWFTPIAIWGAGVLAYYLIELGQMGAHSYYLLPFLPLLLVVVVKGGMILRESRFRPFFLVLLVLQPVMALIRIVPPRFLAKDKAVPQELYAEDSRERLEKAVPNQALCLVGPDGSGCIYFYFLHKKGFGFSRLEDLEENLKGIPVIEEDIHRGAEYLYTNDLSISDRKVLAPYLQSEILREGNFQVYKLWIRSKK